MLHLKFLFWQLSIADFKFRFQNTCILPFIYPCLWFHSSLISWRKKYFFIINTNFWDDTLLNSCHKSSEKLITGHEPLKSDLQNLSLGYLHNINPTFFRSNFFIHLLHLIKFVFFIFIWTAYSASKNQMTYLNWINTFNLIFVIDATIFESSLSRFMLLLKMNAS